MLAFYSSGKTGKEAPPTFSSEEDAGSAEDRVLVSKMISSDAQEKSVPISLTHCRVVHGDSQSSRTFGRMYGAAWKGGG